MKLTQVYMSLDASSFEPLIRARYQFLANYLTLFISDWLKKLKLDLGSFNRVVFEEGNDRDLMVVGEKAFLVCVKPEFKALEDLNTPDKIHEYFVRKYLEGFERFDQKFNLNLSSKLRVQIESYFRSGLKYEIKAKTMKLEEASVQVLHRYMCDKYELVLRYLNRKKEIVKEEVIFKSDPDPFVVHFEINQIELDTNKVRVINGIRKETLLFEIQEEGTRGQV